MSASKTTSREEFLAARRSVVGASDIGAIIGVNERKNAGDVWLEKTGRMPDAEATEAINRGVALEPYVLDLFEMETGKKLIRNIRARHDDVCVATLDAAIPKPNAAVPIALVNDSHSVIYSVGTDRNIGGYLEAPIEAKTTNFGRDWNREPGEVPINVLIQVSYQILCVGEHCQYGMAPALIPEFQRFKFVTPVPIIKRNDELLEELKIAAHEFMNYVRRDVQPPNATPHIESLKRIRREPESVMSLGPEAEEAWESFAAASEKRKGAEADEVEYKRRVLAILGDAEAGRLPDGRLISFLEQNGHRVCDFDALKFELEKIEAAHLYNELVKQGRHRVLRIKAAPKIKSRRR